MHLTPYRLGLVFCMSYILLEAFQAVFLGSLFQQVDSFRVGAWVYGLTLLCCTLVAAIRHPGELRLALRPSPILIQLNICVALTWCCYFLAVQLIEPAIVFTIFSGMVPLGTVLARKLGLIKLESVNRRNESIGYMLILIAIVTLAAVTLSGHSGFVRGSWLSALAGIALCLISGTATSFVILLSVRWHEQGVGPVVQFGLRFMLYIPVAIIAIHFGIDAKPVASTPIAFPMIVLIGMFVISLPLFFMQKAMCLMPASSIASVTALGPAMVFVMQLLDGRIAYAPGTLVGLIIYIAGAVVAVCSMSDNSEYQPHESGTQPPDETEAVADSASFSPATI